MLLIFICFGLLLDIYQSLTVGVTPEKVVCYQIMGHQEEQLTISYVISGIDEKAMTITILDDNKQVLQKSQGKREGEFSQVYPYNGRLSACFQTTAFGFVSFDFLLSKNTKEHVKSGKLNELTESTTKAKINMESIYRNQFFQSTREEVHYNILKQIIENIRISTLSKVAVMVMIGGVQYYFVRKFMDAIQDQQTV